MARPELGEKRRCLSCETKYYDLGKDPIVCPKCGAVFELITADKPAPEEEIKVAETETEVEDIVVDVDPDTVTLEEADDDSGETVDGEDIPDVLPEVETDDDDAADDTFLEDDDDDDDMSDIIHVTKDDKDDS